jgi:hypothetical protein
MSTNKPPPYLAARYGNLHIFPSPTADPAAAKINPILLENSLLSFIICLLSTFAKTHYNIDFSPVKKAFLFILAYSSALYLSL